MKVRSEKEDFKELLKQDSNITDKLTDDEIDNLFDLDKILININKIYKRIGVIN